MLLFENFLYFYVVLSRVFSLVVSPSPGQVMRTYLFSTAQCHVYIVIVVCAICHQVTLVCVAL